jgi:hypothetical protein
MKDLLLYENGVELLTSEGYDILQVIFEDGDSLYMLLYKFQESYQAQTQSIDYNTATGINITKFLNNMSNVLDRNQFMNRFSQIIEGNSIMRMEFSKYVKWIKWGAMTKK